MIKYILKIVLIGFIVFFITNFFFQIGVTRGNSMVPTLKNNELLLIKKFNLNLKNKDIILLEKNNYKIVKRLIGKPKDKIFIKDGYVYVNNKKIDNIYTEYKGLLENEITLKEDEYFVMGDNRLESIDSRDDEIGIINRKNIVGKVLFKT